MITQEERAYKYINDNFDFSMMASVAAALSRVDLKAAYIAGATEEAAIRDAEIKDAEIERLNMSVLGLKSSGNAEKITALESLRQQLTATQEELKEAQEVVGFYAKKQNWGYSSRPKNRAHLSGIIEDYDCGYCLENEKFVGGKRARVFLSKYPRETT